MKHYVLSIIGLLISISMHGQRPVYQHYTVNSGLPSSEVHCVLQDRLGYIWFATDRGVSRFDGYTFTTYTKKEGLSDNTIFNIYEDGKGRIWFYGLSGTFSYFKEGRIYALKVNDKLRDIAYKSSITQIYVDEGDTLWIGMRDAACLWKVHQDRLERVSMPAGMPYIKIMESGYVHGNLTDKRVFPEDTLVIQQGNRRTYLPYMRGNRYSCLPTCIELQAGGYLYIDRDVVLFLDQGRIIGKSWLKSINWINIYEDRQGYIWIYYRTEGVECYRRKGAQLELIATYLPGKTVSRIIEDREGNYWFTTTDDGVYMQSNRAFQCYTQADGLASDKVTRLTANSDGIWAGTYNGVLHRIDNSGKLVQTIELPNDHLQVLGLCTDRQGRIQISAGPTFTYGQGKLFPNTQMPAFARTLSQGASYIWSAENHGIGYFSSDSTYSHIPGFDLFTDGICEDHHGVVWIAAVNGLWQYTSGHFRYEGDDYKLLKTRVMDVKVAEDGSLWMATLGEGVLRKKAGNITQWSTQQGISSNLCNKLYVDSTGSIWICTTKGLNVLHPNAKGAYEVINYTNQGGLTSNEVYDVVRKGNKVWVATSAGITVIDLAAKLPEIPAPLLYINRIAVNGKDTLLESSYSMPHNRNFLSISFTGLFYKNVGHLLYRYKLEGISQGWSYTPYTTVEYPSLPPGDYAFIVGVSNGSGVWHDHAPIKFSVHAPFWRTAWFWLATLLFLAGIGSLFFAIQYRQLMQRNKLLEQLNLYRHQALSVQMNPHFIFNSLNSIQNFILSNDRISSNKYLSKFANLMRITLDNSLQTIIPLERELEALQLYLELEQMRYKDKLSYAIHNEHLSNNSKIKIPALLIQPYVENAIRHGISPKDAPGKVEISIVRTAQQLVCVIEDDGVGREFHQLPSQLSGQKHRSKGMELSRNRIEIMNALYKSSMYLKIIDKLNEENVPTGTRVEIYLPLEV